jgi:DNA repair photolyase
LDMMDNALYFEYFCSMKENKQVFGTHEWAVENANFISGCFHNCKYCYSKEMAIRFKRKTSENWVIEDVDSKQLTLKRKKVNGLIMFPSSHDITPVNLTNSIIFIQNLLASGNKLLIVTKPHIAVIEEICETFSRHKKNILFRFTIGSNNTDTLKFWEPNAPSFEERIKCVIYAYKKGFSTSVSCEPMLDDSTEELVSVLTPYITDSIWIGKANYLLRRLKMNGITDGETLKRAHELILQQSDDNIKILYEDLRSNKKIKWKESIKKIVQLEVSTVKGLDI